MYLSCVPATAAKLPVPECDNVHLLHPTSTAVRREHKPHPLEKRNPLRQEHRRSDQSFTMQLGYLFTCPLSHP